ncbi:MAG: phosphoenolpyruvate carboxykinase domain-containing protein, partial [Syntrophales bacterium]|nr:phosphoenolpyruvate carboxykinase domain-containing protein [Syntrophales bacterium]
ANARFTAPASQCPAIDPSWEDPRGVPISAILFGGRRPGVVPLVNQAFDWRHGTFLGSIVSSETTAAAQGKVGQVRRDPFAMLPFCGYHMADYFAHWLNIGRSADPAKLPKIFYVNWFRKTKEGKWLWPGYGENSRVLKWIFERTEGAGGSVETPIGHLPTPDAIDRKGLSVSASDMQQLVEVDRDAWLSELDGIRQHYAKFGERMPQELWDELKTLEERLRNFRKG